MRAFPAALLLAFACAPPATAQAFQRDTASERMNRMSPPLDAPAEVSLPGGRVEVPLEGPHGRPRVDVTVNGRGPYRFVVETGAGFTSVTPEAAAALGLKPGDDANPSVVVDSIGIGGGTLRRFRIGVYPLGIAGVDGILGLNAYRDLLLTVDYPGRKVRLERGTLPAANGRDRLALIANEELWELDIEVAGRKSRAVLDTQGSGAFNVTPEAARSAPFEAPPVVTGTASGPGIGTQQLRTARLASDARVGDVVFQRPLVGIIPMPPGYPEHWNLGGPALREFVMTLDQRSRVLRLARPGRAPVAAPPSLRTAGFRTRMSGGTRLVSVVMPGSEAERLGIAVGDEVLAVDGHPVATLDARPWSELIAKDSPVTFRLRRDGAVREVAITPAVEVR